MCDKQIYNKTLYSIIHTGLNGLFKLHMYIYDANEQIVQ